MQSQRTSVKNNFQVYEGEFVYRFILGCIKQSCYVMLKKGTIYIYDSKRSCLNNPQKPKQFFNLNTIKMSRNGHYLTLEDSFSRVTLWSLKEQGASMLQNHLDAQKVFPKKFVELNCRIDQKLKQERNN